MYNLTVRLYQWQAHHILRSIFVMTQRTRCQRSGSRPSDLDRPLENMEQIIVLNCSPGYLVRCHALAFLIDYNDLIYSFTFTKHQNKQTRVTYNLKITNVKVQLKVTFRWMITAFLHYFRARQFLVQMSRKFKERRELGSGQLQLLKHW